MPSLLSALGLDPDDAAALRGFARKAGVPVPLLRQPEATPLSAEVTARLCAAAGITPLELALRLGHLDARLRAALARRAPAVAALLAADLAAPPRPPPGLPAPAFTTALGTLYRADCLAVMRALPEAHVDLIFADPPFNLGKAYPSHIDDDRPVDDYLGWCEAWLDECVRLLRPGGSLFVWNLPRWNTALAAFLNRRLTFRHWIAVSFKSRLPITGRLYPAHYALLYYVKGPRPKTFHPDRLPMPVCPHCHGDLRDYGGYKHKMNPAGVSLPDVWDDIPPVRHARYKGRTGANELPLRLLDRVLTLASDPGDLVFDPFGGAGTTYVAAELKGRRWLGVEIGPGVAIAERFARLDAERAYLARLREGYNHLFLPDILAARQARGLWTPATVGPNGTAPPPAGVDPGADTIV